MRNEFERRPRTRIGGEGAGRDGNKRETFHFAHDAQNEHRTRRTDDNRREYRSYHAERNERNSDFGHDNEQRRSYGSYHRFRDNSETEQRPQRRSFDHYGEGNSRSGFDGEHRTNRYGNGFRRPQYGNNDQYRRPYRQHDENFDENAKYSQKKQIAHRKQFINYNEPMRLNKFLANSGICSRREADEYIQAGVVTVNGNVVTELGTKVVPATDTVLFHDQLVRCERRIYILLNKPKDCVTTSDDPQARLTVLDLVKGACAERVYPVGRLDRNTTGVLLITNDGDLTSKMTHPKYNQKKIYEAVLDRDFTEEDMQRLRDGLELEDGEIHADDISYSDPSDPRKVGVEIHSGRNRIVRRMFDAIGYKVLRLDRVYFAGLTKKNLPRGKWRFLSESEINMLKMTR